MKHDLVVVEWKKNYPRKTIYPPKKNARKFHSKFFSACVVYYTHTHTHTVKLSIIKMKKKRKKFSFTSTDNNEKKIIIRVSDFFLFDDRSIDYWWLKKRRNFCFLLSLSLFLFGLIDLNFFFRCLSKISRRWCFTYLVVV